jgi:lipopolysaccharide assembly outer membrane protein LptD (OstA)
MRKTGILVLPVVLLVTWPVFAQSGRADTAEISATSDEKKADSLPDYIEMDIRTSRLDELADWCRRLGLSDAGSRDELAGRLRDYYGITSPAPGSNATESKSITIESARTTEYFTLEAVNETYARLSGSVVITLKDGESLHRLKADEVLFNRTRNILNAKGSVEYTKESGGVKETFKGDSITISLDNWEGVFLGGASERSQSDNSTTYRFAGDVISRDAEEVTVLKNAKITSASRDESYWSIAATKLWLLPSSDWAMANAVLKVGEVPLLYIPFMYLPGDEVVFHPVLGYRSRESSFVQTTTYLIGRPKASSSTENSITKILGSGSDTERKREGLFLRSTGKRVQNQDAPSLSLLFDVYTNLGAYAGMNASIPKTGILGKTDLSFGLGLTRDIYQPQVNYYTPFKNNDGISHWNSSDLFGYTIPFRYRFKSTGSLQTSWFSLSWELPLYSDPFVDRDFLNRTESMDWLQMIKEGSNQTQTNSGTQVSTLGSYQWRLNTTFPAPIVFIKPSIATLSVNSLSSSLYFNTRAVSNPASPLDSLFFYPERLTLYSTSFSLRGTLLGNSDSKPVSVKPEPKAASANPTAGPQLQVPDAWSPWAGEEPTSRTVTSPTQGANNDPLAVLQPPELQQTFTMTAAQNPVQIQVDYSFNPSFSTELFFQSSSANWPTKEAIRWDEYSSIFTNFRSDASLGLTVADPTGMVSTALKLTDQNGLQVYNYINESAEEFDTSAEKNAALLRSYNGTYNNVGSEFTFKLSPFIQDEVWKATSVQYSLRGIFVKTAYTGDAETGSWLTTYGQWTKDYITAHQVQLNLLANTGTQTQSSTLSLDLPPRNSTLKSSSAISLGMSRTSLSFSVSDPFETPVYNPITASEELKLSQKLSLKQDLVYDPTLNTLNSWNTSAVLGPVSAAYRAQKNAQSGTLEPTAFSLNYIDSFKDTSLWKNRVAYSLDINSSLNMDLQRYTNSVFTFSLGTTVKIAQFLDVSFSTKSQNSVVFRYVQNWPIWESHITMPGEQNPLIDLLDSFRFDNENLRKKSGFKLKSLSFKAVHYLGDWNATLGIDLTPYLNTAISPKRYQYNTAVSFLVQWVPIPEIKTETFSDTKNGFIFK